MNILRLFLSRDLSRLSEEVADLTRRVDRLVKTEELRRKAKLQRFVNEGRAKTPRPVGFAIVDSANRAPLGTRLSWSDTLQAATVTLEHAERQGWKDLRIVRLVAVEVGAPVDQGTWFPCLYRSKPRPDGLKCVQYVESFFDSADAAKAAAASIWPDPYEDCTYGAVKVADVR